MTRLEVLARVLCQAEGHDPDAMVPYQTLSSGLRARCEQPRHGAPLWDEMPSWQWTNAGRARDILEHLGTDPAEVLPDAVVPRQHRPDDSHRPHVVHDRAKPGGKSPPHCTASPTPEIILRMSRVVDLSRAVRS